MLIFSWRITWKREITGFTYTVITKQKPSYSVSELVITGDYVSVQ